MLHTKKLKNELSVIEEDLHYLRGKVDHLYKKVNEELMPYDEFKLVKFFVGLILILLCIFEIISITLILAQ